MNGDKADDRGDERGEDRGEERGEDETSPLGEKKTVRQRKVLMRGLAGESLGCKGPAQGG